jgi:hypothetical protein
MSPGHVPINSPRALKILAAREKQQQDYEIRRATADEIRRQIGERNNNYGSASFTQANIRSAGNTFEHDARLVQQAEADAGAKHDAERKEEQHREAVERNLQSPQRFRNYHEATEQKKDWAVIEYARTRGHIAPRDNDFSYVSKGTRERVMTELQSPEFFKAYFPEGWEKYKVLKMQSMKLEH